MSSNMWPTLSSVPTAKNNKAAPNGNGDPRTPYQSYASKAALPKADLNISSLIRRTEKLIKWCEDEVKCPALNKILKQVLSNLITCPNNPTSPPMFGGVTTIDELLVSYESVMNVSTSHSERINQLLQLIDEQRDMIVSLQTGMAALKERETARELEAYFGDFCARIRYALIEAYETPTKIWSDFTTSLSHEHEKSP